MSCAFVGRVIAVYIPPSKLLGHVFDDFVFLYRASLCISFSTLEAGRHASTTEIIDEFLVNIDQGGSHFGHRFSNQVHAGADVNLSACHPCRQHSYIQCFRVGCLS